MDPPTPQSRLNTITGSTAEMRWPATWSFAAVAGLTLLAACTRAYHLGQPSLWYDELRTLHGAMTLDVGFSKLLGYLPNAAGLAVHGVEASAELAEHPERWRALGIDEIAARWPSCVLGIATVPVLYLLARPVIGSGAALAAALLLATSMWHVFWSQNARFYTIQFLFYNASLLMYVDWHQTRRIGTGAGALLCLILAALSQPTAVVLLGVFILDSLWRLAEAGNWRAFILVLIGAAVAAVMVGAAAGIDVWQNPSNWTHFFDKANLPPFRLVFSSGYLIGPPVILFGLIGGWRALRRRDATGRTLLLAAVLPALLFTLLALGARVEQRYLLPCLYAWLALAVWTACGLAAEAGFAARRTFAAIIAILLAAQMIPLRDYYTQNGYRPYTREAVDWVQRHRTPGERVFMDDLEGSYYFGERVAGEPPSIEGLATVEPAPAWLVYRTDERGTKPAPEPWTETNTQLKAVYGQDGIKRMARVYVRYWPGAGESPNVETSKRPY